ncbi:MAG: isopenicillin N synthase family oxygenase [Alphaproteobacteria bacterium]|jgi:isopenicillin N synthase-like dioxygenase|nr:isopenicillin N synthase family oxygenase [Alphaproteobacteria bacterium]
MTATADADARPWSIPVIDIGPFLHNEPAGRARVIKEWAEAFETLGFATIVGHGIEEDLLDRLHEAARRFFDQDVAAKRRCSFPGEQRSQGYVPMGVESVAKSLDDAAAPADLCESLTFAFVDWEAAPPTDPGDAALFRPNLWPQQPPELEGLIRTYFDRVHALAHALMRLGALALDLPEDHFAATHDRMTTNLRLVHYPDQVADPLPGQLRYGAHTDYTGLTIVRQDDAPGGLQVRAPDGSWIDVPPVRGAFVVNAGDLLMRWTNHRWQSNVHRVMNPPRDAAGSTRRLSIVLFTGPNADAVVDCLPTCHGPGNPPKYGPIKAWDHLMERIGATMPDGLD